MSKRINVNPDHYKVAGRERQGENIVHSTERRALARLRRQERLVHPIAPEPPERPKSGAKAAASGATRARAAAAGAKPAQAAASTRSREQARAPRTGISNRESPQDEARERREFPPVGEGSPPPEDAAGRVGEQPLEDSRDRHTSHKAGSRSIAQKEAEARYTDRSMPAARKVAGAFGREPQRAAGSNDTGVVRRARPKRAAKARRKKR